LNFEFCLQVDVNMGAQRRIADGVSPIHEAILNVRRHFLQARRDIGERFGISGLALQGIAREPIARKIGADAPVGAAVIASNVGPDKVPLAQAAHLIIDGIEDPQRMARPVVVRIFLWPIFYLVE